MWMKFGKSRAEWDHTAMGLYTASSIFLAVASAFGAGERSEAEWWSYNPYRQERQTSKREENEIANRLAEQFVRSVHQTQLLNPEKQEMAIESIIKAHKCRVAESKQAKPT